MRSDLRWVDLHRTGINMQFKNAYIPEPNFPGSSFASINLVLTFQSVDEIRLYHQLNVSY